VEELQALFTLLALRIKNYLKRRTSMSNQQSENLQPFTPHTAGASLRIEQLSEETHELSDEESKAIAGGLLRHELSDGQLEAFAGGRVSSIIHVIGFEN
jgi:two-component sensor histidine kinase